MHIDSIKHIKFKKKNLTTLFVLTDSIIRSHTYFVIISKLT